MCFSFLSCAPTRDANGADNAHEGEDHPGQGQCVADDIDLHRLRGVQVVRECVVDEVRDDAQRCDEETAP
jgi:hypothetical protein